MGFREKINYLRNNPRAVMDFLSLSSQLAKNREKGIYSFLFQCDAKGHFPYLKPYLDALKENNNVAIYFTGTNIDGEVISFLLKNGIRNDRIIRHNSLVRLTEWDIYLSPTSWGNIFPKNQDCPRVQLFHTLADKNIQYGKNLLKFNKIFVCGPIHHDFLKRYLFDPFPEAETKCTTYNVGFAKIDALLNDSYDHKDLKKELKITEEDNRKIVLYAPNWETTSALHRYKDQVFDVLKKTKYLVLIKLHYMSMLSPGNVLATGGIDWKKLLDRYECEENMRIIHDVSIDPYLSISDLLVTDYGGVSFEFMCTGKPIVYLDCPEFFDIRGKDIMEYWARETGFLVSDMEQLPEIMKTAMQGDAQRSRMQKELVERLLYNPGAAAETGIRIIFNQLLGINYRSGF